MHCAGVPEALPFDPIASELGPGWISLRWTKPQSNPPVLAYKVEAWDVGEARWFPVSVSICFYARQNAHTSLPCNQLVLHFFFLQTAWNDTNPKF